jgi:hypothetical protein
VNGSGALHEKYRPRKPEYLEEQSTSALEGLMTAESIVRLCFVTDSYSQEERAALGSLKSAGPTLVPLFA